MLQIVESVSLDPETGVGAEHGTIVFDAVTQARLVTASFQCSEGEPSPSATQQAAWKQADLYLVDNPLAEHTSPITGNQMCPLVVRIVYRCRIC